MQETIKKRPGRPEVNINLPELKQFTIKDVMGINSVTRVCIQNKLNKQVRLGVLRQLKNSGKVPSIYIKNEQS